jgi:3-keto-5-aminohexanoate cleavage enzyme
MEDTLYLEKGKQASSNKVLVEKAVAIMKILNKEPATPEEAKDLIQLR